MQFDNDAARREHYEQMRVKKKRCDTFYGWCMIGALAFGVVEILITNGFISVLKLGMGKQAGLLSIALGIGILVTEVLGLYRRSWKLTLTALLCWIELCVVSGGIVNVGSLAVIAASFFAHRTWHALELEEGFPLFELNTEENEQQFLTAQHNRALTDRPLPPPCADDGNTKTFNPGEMDSI